jgi:hypothetical protein
LVTAVPTPRDPDEGGGEGIYLGLLAGPAAQVASATLSETIDFGCAFSASELGSITSVL